MILLYIIFGLLVLNAVVFYSRLFAFVIEDYYRRKRIEKSNAEFEAKERERWKRVGATGRSPDCYHLWCEKCKGDIDNCEDSDWHDTCGCGCATCNPGAYGFHL